MRLDQLAGRRVCILGFGREGQSAWRVLQARQPRARVEVWVESGQLPAQVEGQVAPFDERLGAFDVLLRSPGIPVVHPMLEAARQSGVRVINPASIWFSERSDLPVIGVTGSKGKSTTASLLAALLSASGQRILLAGNIGVPLLDHLDTSVDRVVLELSSYQLADLEGQLDIGVMTRLFPEHLDWHGSVEAYYACKLRLVDLLAGRALIINASDPVLLQVAGDRPGCVAGNRPPRFYRCDEHLLLGDEVLLNASEIALIGRHNLDNAALALEAACLAGGALEPMLEALKRFRPLTHRLETVSSRHARRWINDSIATSPHATRAALESLSGERVVLIVGGQARPADWTPVLDWCQERPLAGLIGLPDTGDRVVRMLSEAGAVAASDIRLAEDLDQAVAAAMALSEPGAVVLLSPGAPSFPRYRNFEQRGQSYGEAIERYRERSTA